MEVMKILAISSNWDSAKIFHCNRGWIANSRYDFVNLSEFCEKQLCNPLLI